MQIRKQFKILLTSLLALVVVGGGLRAGVLREDRFHPFFGGKLKGKVLILSPEDGAPRANILFLTGYYDRPDNHIPLFETWAKSGLRVVSFAYPSHDENSGPYNFLSLHRFQTLYQMIAEVEREFLAETKLPLFLSGWSLGGELAVRLVQTGRSDLFTEKPRGLILLAPAVSVFPILGELNIATMRTLTQNAEYPFGGKLKPVSPIIHTPFTLSLLWNAFLSQQSPMPADLPTFVATAGRDKYVRSEGVMRWINYQRSRGASISHSHYPKALHMLDAEAPEIAGVTTNFCGRILNGLGR